MIKQFINLFDSPIKHTYKLKNMDHAYRLIFHCGCDVNIYESSYMSFYSLINDKCDDHRNTYDFTHNFDGVKIENIEDILPQIKRILYRGRTFKFKEKDSETIKITQQMEAM